MRAKAVTEALIQAPEHPHDLPQHLHVVGVDRLERGVLGLEANAAVGLAVEGLDGRLVRGLVVPDERDDDVAVAGVVAALDDDRVAVEDPGVDHRVAVHGEQEVGAAAERLRHGDDVLDVLLGEERPAGRDAAEQREARHVAGGRRASTRLWPVSSSARGFVGSRRIRPTRSRFARCAWTVEGEASPTSSPISRTVGG